MVHPPVSEIFESFTQLSMTGSGKHVPGHICGRFNKVFHARYPSKEYVERVWKFLIGRPGNGKIPVWEASPLYKQGIAGLEGAAYEQQLVLLGSCISIMMELDMISSDLVNRMPMFVLHRPKGQVSLSGSPMYVQGRRLRKTAGQLMQRFEGGLRHGGKR